MAVLDIPYNITDNVIDQAVVSAGEMLQIFQMFVQMKGADPSKLVVLTFCSGRQVSDVMKAADAAGFKYVTWFILDKSNTSYYTGVRTFTFDAEIGVYAIYNRGNCTWRCEGNTGNDEDQRPGIVYKCEEYKRYTMQGTGTYNPFQKPLDVIHKMVRRHVIPGNLVIDAFGGSGTTSIAAAMVGASTYYADLDPPQHLLAQSRFCAWMQDEADRAKAGVTSSGAGPRKKLKLMPGNPGAISSTSSSCTSTELRPTQVAVMEDTDNKEAVATEKQSE